MGNRSAVSKLMDRDGLETNRREYHLVRDMYFVLFVIEGDKVTVREFWGYDIRSNKVMDRKQARKKWTRYLAAGYTER